MHVCRLFRERQNQVKVKLDEVLTGKAGEYREPLDALQNSMQIRTQVAGKTVSEMFFWFYVDIVCRNVSWRQH